MRALTQSYTLNVEDEVVGNIGHINVQVETAVKPGTDGEGDIIEVKTEICRGFSVVVVPVVIQAQGPSPAEIDDRAEDRADLIFIQIEVIQINLDVGLSFLDVAEFAVGLVELGTAVKRKTFVQHVDAGILRRPCVREP